MKLNSEDIIILNEFKARDYQEPILDAIFNRGIRRMVVTLPRRAGKDVALWNCAIRQCLLKPCLVLYVCPSHRLGKRNVWDMIGMDGKRFADYIPERLILKKNESEMKITFKNNSILQVVGALNHDDSIRGGNPTGVVLSEYAYYKDGTILDTVSPIIAANPDAWLVLASTPQGKNHFYQIWTIAQQLKDWWTYKKTVDDTKHISPENLEAERMRMSPEMFMQEYYCSFDRGIDGAIFGKALNHLRLNEHITTVSHQPQLLTHVSIDIGLSKGNATTIIWFQVVGDGQIINIIDCYSSENLGLDFYAQLLQERQVKYGYKMGVYLAPHDLAVREWGAGAVTRYEKARQLDINFTILDQHLLADQIENALTHFPKVWIDERKCKALIDALENYHRIWDEERGVYSQKPAHTWACFVANTLVMTKSGNKSIIDIQQDEEILTLEGWKKCNKASLMKRNAQLVEVTFKDGTKVKCTPEHKFLTVKGWKSAKDLTKDIAIRSTLTQSHNTSMDIFTEYIPHRNIFPRVEQHYIEMFGVMDMVKYLKNLIYTILTPITLTTTYGISSVCPKMSIERFQDQTIKELVQNAEKHLWNGTNLKQQSYGEKEIKNDKLLGLSGNESHENVQDVKKLSLDLQDQENSIRNGVEKNAGFLTIESVKHLSEKANVYCINVPDVHHFSLSNGAVVHNSNYASAFMGMFLGLHHTYSGRSANDYERLRQESQYGASTAHLPRIFRQGIKEIMDR